MSSDFQAMIAKAKEFCPDIEHQIQIMMDDQDGWHMFHLFTHWVERGSDWALLDTSSMRQFWLGFVMKETYNRRWNGKEWITD